MTRAVHLLDSVPLHDRASAVAARLRRDPQTVAAAATGASLAALSATAQRWSRRPHRLPSIDVRVPDGEEPGSLVVSWTGQSEVTGWPATEATLLALPQPDGGSRLAMLSPTTPHRGAPAQRLGRPDGGRARRLALRRFLREVAAVVTAEPPASMRTAPTKRTAPPARSGDHDARFVHALQAVSLDPGEAADRLQDVAPLQADAATAAAIADCQPALEAGRFRAPPAPRVEVRRGHLVGLATTELAWSDDEEASGWPSLTLSLLVEPAIEGVRLLALARRAPRYDLSVNRVDKQARDVILRTAGGSAVAALADALASPAPISPRPVAAASR